MKFILVLSLLVASTGYASESTILKAEGFKEITITGMLNPFGGAVKSARKIAKKNLVTKCQEELGGTIVGEISYETLRFDEGIMGAEVEATGECLR